MSPLPGSVRVRVPGSTSNCGAGFDTLGLALQIYNQVVIAPAAGALPIPATPSDGRALAMVTGAAQAFFAAAGCPAAGFTFSIAGDVPPARGLGSSVTVIAGILAGLNALHGARFGREDLVRVATALEGHPDNASAGILGGFCVARCDPLSGVYRHTLRFEVPDEISFVVVSPETELLTKESRGVLPDTLPYFDAVRSINSATYLVAAFAARDYACLRDAGGDFMHEPYRLPKIRGAREAIAAGVAAGGYVGWLSGSGSSVLTVAPQAAAAAVQAAMAGAFAAVGIRSTGRALAADNHGLVVE
jgi:homoserine kinase